MGFKIYKLGRKASPESGSPAQVSNGFKFKCDEIGYLDLSDRDNVEKKTIKEISDLIGNLAFFEGDRMHDWIRTSVIRSVYEHGGEIDKLILPKEFPKEDYLNMESPEMRDGDVLIATMNSIYLAQKVDNKE